MKSVRRKPLRVKLKGPHPANRVAYKSDKAVARLEAGGGIHNLRVLERAGAQPASSFTKKGRENIHLHPRALRAHV